MLEGFIMPIYILESTLAYGHSRYQAIRHNGVNPVTAADGLNVIKIIEAAFKSNIEKRIITV